MSFIFHGHANANFHGLLLCGNVVTWQKPIFYLNSQNIAIIFAHKLQNCCYHNFPIYLHYFYLLFWAYCLYCLRIASYLCKKKLILYLNRFNYKICLKIVIFAKNLKDFLRFFKRIQLMPFNSKMPNKIFKATLHTKTHQILKKKNNYHKFPM